MSSPGAVPLGTPLDIPDEPFLNSPASKPVFLPGGNYTLLPVIDACDTAKLPSRLNNYAKTSDNDERLVPFFARPLHNDDLKHETPIGFLRDQVVKALLEDNNKMKSIKCQPCFWVSQTADDVDAIAFESWFDDEDYPFGARTEHMERLVRSWKENGLFLDQLSGWRNEEYAIYGTSTNPISPLPGGNKLFKLERSACALFSFATFGVHMTGYVPATETEDMKIWIARRAQTKQTWPGMLDNCVAGGITYGDSPSDAMVRECAEEASLPVEFVRKNILSAGIVSYTTNRGTHGWIQPEVQYVYDLALPSSCGVKPTTNPEDGEVEGFELMEVKDVIQKMLEGEFKPNCALVMIDFLVRHGRITPESDTKYLEICLRLRQPLGLPMPT